MSYDNSLEVGSFDDIDMSDLDLLDIEIVQTTGVAGIPETGASCCWYFMCNCSSCGTEDEIPPG